jgi:hypothetical protein
MKVSDLPPAYGSPENAPVEFEIPMLPSGTTLAKVYTDFIRYLHTNARRFFVESTPNGQSIWDRLEHGIVYIFCTPNGWDISQQVFLRDAAMIAGLFGAGDVDERVEFITEGEASVHYALAHTRSTRWLKEHGIFVVIDAGGSTIDSTLYECKGLQPLQLEEVCASECVQVSLLNKSFSSHF